MRCLDWATRMRDEGGCVMSGFQSPLEKEVLNILLKGTSPLILVLARRMWDERHIPTLFRKPLAEGRLLVVSPVSQTIRRADACSAALRNRYILGERKLLSILSPTVFQNLRPANLCKNNCPVPVDVFRPSMVDCGKERCF